MVNSILAIVVVAISFWAARTGAQWSNSILAAKATGLPYIVTPWQPFNTLWKLFQKPLMPLILLLPKSWTERALSVLVDDFAYTNLETTWAQTGETFIVASPGKLSMFTSNASAISRIATQKDQFPKSLAQYGLLRLFGENVVTVEGQLWRAHRKATAISFTEKNSSHVFRESVAQTQGMVEKWIGPEAEGNKSSKDITTLEHDTMTLALNIIAYAGFGLRLLWPGQNQAEDADAMSKKYGNLVPPPGHTLSWAQSLETVLDKIIAIMLLPPWLLRILPFKATKQALQGRENYEQYMQEFLQDKTDEVRGAGKSEDAGMDIMGELIRARELDGDAVASKADGKVWTPTDSDILGNAFIMLLAGHETTANTLHFTIIELANNPSTQIALQADIDRIMGRDTDPKTWTYEQHINAMLSSMMGACMNETLRTMPPVVDIPKMTPADRGQSLAIDGKEHMLPPKMDVYLNSIGAQRNERYWPSEPSKIHIGKQDLNDWVPDRWYRTTPTSSKSSSPTRQETPRSSTTSLPITHREMFKPVKGSFIPFSDGARSCLGKRIAQVEMVSALAVLFQKYTVELAVDQWASDEEVAKMTVAEKTKLYRQAQEHSRGMLRKARTIITLKMHAPDHVPIRLVRRGCERFVGVVEV